MVPRGSLCGIGVTTFGGSFPACVGPLREERWGNFAKTLLPEGTSATLPTWPAFANESRWGMVQSFADSLVWEQGNYFRHFIHKPIR
eukprot:124255-Amphidinium_carterae.1